MRIARVRVVLVGAVVGLLFCMLAGRLFFIQIVKGQEYALKSRSQTRQRTILPAARGRICDVRGRVLAKSVQVRMQAETDNAALAELKDRGSKKTGASHLGRVYPYGEIAGAVLGYVGRDGDGLGGAEQAFDRRLRGENGWVILQRDGRNYRYRKAGLPRHLPQSGCDVYLTIDVEIQKIVENVLAQTVDKLAAKGAMCMVTDPMSGRILAMASRPGFNPNVPSRYTMDERINRCIGYNYEPGSTYKVVTAGAAMQEGVKSEGDTLDGNGGVYRIYDQTIRDRMPFGKMTFAQALAKSSNVCFARVGRDLGDARLYRYTKDFGFGARSGLLLPGEESGVVRPVSQWSGRTGATMAIGQEMSATLLQVMMAFGSIANGGIVLEPCFCDKVVDGNGVIVETGQYRPVRRVVSEDVAARMRQLLGGVVADGTGRRAAIAGIPVGGKTGTSQKYDTAADAYSSSAYWSSFVGFVPLDQPLLLCGVVIDEPASGQGGGDAAAPAFARIVTQIISNPELDYGERILARCRTTAVAVPKGGPTPPVSRLSGAAGGATREAGRDASNARKHASDPSAGGGVKGKKSSLVYVPEVRNRDVREAVREMNTRGLVPYVNGSGTVRTQSLCAGTLAQRAAVCTLYCAIGG